LKKIDYEEEDEDEEKQKRRPGKPERLEREA